MKKNGPLRKKITTKINTNLVDELKNLAIDIDFPASRIMEEGIIYILKKKKSVPSNNASKSSLCLTINPQLWNQFKKYATENNQIMAYLLEEGLSHSLKEYHKKIEKKQFENTNL